MGRNHGFSRRLLLSVDARGYGARTDNGQGILQAGLRSILDKSAEQAGLDRASWQRQVAGDGELSILPASEPEPLVVDDFARELAAELEEYNESRSVNYQIRLRMAIHFGAAMPADMGFTGQGVVQVSRLVDSTPVRSILKDERVGLAVIISDNVFQDIVVQGHTSLRPKDFREVSVSSKEYAKRAWVRAPGWGPHSLQVLDDTPPSPVTARKVDAPDQANPVNQHIHTEFHEHVRAEQIIIGGSS